MHRCCSCPVLLSVMVLLCHAAGTGTGTTPRAPAQLEGGHRAETYIYVYISKYEALPGQCTCPAIWRVDGQPASRTALLTSSMWGHEYGTGQFIKTSSLLIARSCGRIQIMKRCAHMLAPLAKTETQSSACRENGGVENATR